MMHESHCRVDDAGARHDGEEAEKMIAVAHCVGRRVDGQGRHLGGLLAWASQINQLRKASNWRRCHEVRKAGVARDNVDDGAVMYGVTREKLLRTYRPKSDGAIRIADGEPIEVDPGHGFWRYTPFVCDLESGKRPGDFL